MTRTKTKPLAAPAATISAIERCAGAESSVEASAEPWNGNSSAKCAASSSRRSARRR